MPRPRQNRSSPGGPHAAAGPSCIRSPAPARSLHCPLDRCDDLVARAGRVQRRPDPNRAEERNREHSPFGSARPLSFSQAGTNGTPGALDQVRDPGCGPLLLRLTLLDRGDAAPELIDEIA